MPSHTPTPSQTPTPAPTAVAGPALYFSLGSDGSAGGLTVANEDIVAWDGLQGFSVLFDGSDVGVAGLALDAFAVGPGAQPDILISFTAAGAIPGISGTVDDSDIVKFTPTSLGPTTSGSFSLYFDASDVGLTQAGEDVDAVELLPDGHLLISTTGVFEVGGADEDIIEFAPTLLGPTTAGSWSFYFDGSDVALSDEDMDGLTLDASGVIYLSTTGAFAINGLSGADEDVFSFTPTSLGPTTSGTYGSTLFFDGSGFGLGANDLAAIDLPSS